MTTFSTSRFTALLAVCILLFGRLGAAVHFVNANATGANTGASWADARKELATALDAAVPGDEVWVAKGIYRPDYDTSTGTHTGNRTLRFTVKDGVSVFGGFAGGEASRSQRDLTANRTILSGDIGTPGVNTDNTRTLLVTAGIGSAPANNVLLEGLVLAGGQADDPAELGNGIVGGSGGAVYIYYGSATFRHCVFVDNYAVYGGAISIQSATGNGLTLVNCLFAANSARYVGGAVNFQSYTGKLNVLQCTIVNNTSSRGSAIGTNNQVTCTYHNNLIFSNPSTSSGWQSVETGASLTAAGNVSQLLFGTASADNLVVSVSGLLEVPSAGPDGIWGTQDDILRATPSSAGALVGAGKLAFVPADSTDQDGDFNVLEVLPYDLARNPRVRGAAVEAGAFAFFNRPSTDITLSSGSIAENLPAGTTVGTLATVDPDGGTFTYSLVEGAGAADNSLFTLQGSTLKTAQILDYEAKASLSVRVRTTDPLGATFEKSFALSVIDTVDPTVHDFALGQNTLKLALVAGINHYPVRLPVTPVLAGFDFGALQVRSDASWVAGSVDSTTRELVLTFNTAALLNASYTATISLTNPGGTKTLSLAGTLGTLSLLSLQDDPTRSRMYGLNQNGTLAGALVVIDPLTGNTLGSVSVGDKPTDFALSSDGSEALVLCIQNKEIVAVDLASLTVRGRIALSSFDIYDIQTQCGHIAYGPGDVIYYVDGAWAPVLRVLKRSTGQILQTVTSDTNNSSSSYGFGDISVAPDGLNLYAWVQYGWSAGYAGSYMVRHTITGNGMLAYHSKNTLSYPNYNRDPLDTSTYVSRDNTTVVAKTVAVAGSDITNIRRTFSSPVYAVTPNMEIIATATALHEMATGNSLYTLPVAGSVKAFTSDYARLVYFDATRRTLGTINLPQTIGNTVMGRTVSPAEGAIVLPPSSLSWSPLPGIDRYQIYLGTSAQAVGNATRTSAEYLGEVTGSTFTLTAPLTVGLTYHWRVDAVTASEVSPGQVRSFTVSSISTSLTKIQAATVQGHADFLVPVGFTSVAPGESFTLSSADSWISFPSGPITTPATINLHLDASQLTTGLKRSTLTVTTGSGPISIPVELQVDPLSLTMLRSRPGSTKVYGISEASTQGSRAYLLEIDTLRKRISRATPAGQNVTDMAVHPADSRVYVTNWNQGFLLAFDLADLTLKRTYAFDLPGLYANDVYRIAAAGPGRLIFEPQDQWVNIGILDTATGITSAPTSQREGDGICDPTGRYYYRCDNNSSNAAFHKFDTAGNVFTSVATDSSPGLSYYGSRNVVMAENGSKFFYNGNAFNPDLSVAVNLGDEIYSASADGTFAFGQTTIHNTATQKTAGTLPATTKISAYNTATGRLVLAGPDGLIFYSLTDAGLAGTGNTPEHLSLVSAPPRLSWPAMPSATAYRVYLGTSAQAVSDATTASPLYLGEVSTAYLNLASPLANGTYYWRIDYVVDGDTAPGDVRSFSVTTVAPSQRSFAFETIRGDRFLDGQIGLSSATAGTAWTASSSAPWLTLAAASGTTPATLAFTLETTTLASGDHQAFITLTSGAESYTIPVSLTLSALHVTLLKSVPGSAFVYAVSEAPATGDGPSRAHLLEINTSTAAITRVVRIGSGVTDIAVHTGDNRVYATNWSVGRLYSVRLSDFNVDQIYEVPSFGGIGYGDGDAYTLSAGGPGRLIFEAADQWVDVSLFNTTTGRVITAMNQRQGGGAHAPGGRYYYHGDDNISDASLRKFDTVGDAFTGLGGMRSSAVSYYGSRLVVISGDGNRIFWNGSMFDPSLNILWSPAAITYSTTTTGRFAFGETQILDTVSRQVVMGMPVSTRLSAYSAVTDTLVTPGGSDFLFNTVGNGDALGAPVLLTPTPSTPTLTLNWTDLSLETAFTLQQRPAGAADWQDVSSTIGQNDTTHSFAVNPGTTYEFRIKATSPTLSSPWSNTVSVTAPLPSLDAYAYALSPGSIQVSWTSSTGYDDVVVQRSLADGDIWTVLATVATPATQYFDSSVLPETTYRYRLVTRRGALASPPGSSVSVTTPAIVLATAPTLLSVEDILPTSLLADWSDVASATGYRVERSPDGTSNWQQVADLPASSSSLRQDSLTTGSTYWYRVRSYNDYSVSDYSNILSATLRPAGTGMADNFNSGSSGPGWLSLSGAGVFNGGNGFGGSPVLWFGSGETRSATTRPLNLSSNSRITFRFRAGNTSVDGSSYWENSDPGENVVMEYSLDGLSWIQFATLSTLSAESGTWTDQSLLLPAQARSPGTMVRWRQLSHSGSYYDTWALDDVSIFTELPLLPVAPDFILVSPVADTRIALTWNGGSGAETYVVERSLDGVTWSVIAMRSASAAYHTDSDCHPRSWYGYRIRAVNSAGTSSASPVGWAQTYRQMEYWRLSNFGLIAPVGEAAPLARGQDQISNLEKFGFGIQPGEPRHVRTPGSNEGGLPSVWFDSASNRLCVEFLRRSPDSNPGVSYVVQFSDDMTSWTNGGTLTQTVPVDALWERVRFEINPGTGSQAQGRFCRVKLINED